MSGVTVNQQERSNSSHHPLERERPSQPRASSVRSEPGGRGRYCEWTVNRTNQDSFEYLGDVGPPKYQEFEDDLPSIPSEHDSLEYWRQENMRTMTLWERLRWHVRVHGIDEEYAIPVPWLRLLACLHIVCFCLIALGETLMESDQHLGTAQSRGWVLTLMASVLVVNGMATWIFLCCPGERKLVALFLLSCVSGLVLCLVVFKTEDDLIVFQRLNSLYSRDIPRGWLSPETLVFGFMFTHDESGKMAFPPGKIVILSVLKAFGSFFGLVCAKLMIATILWIKFDIVYESPDKPIEEITDEEADDDERDQMRRSKLAKAGVLLTLTFLVCSVSFYLVTSVLNAITVIDLDFILFLTRVKFIFCYFICIIALLILEFRMYPSEVRELKLIVFSIVIMVILAFMSAVVTDVKIHSSMLTEMSKSPEFATNSSSPFCVEACLVSWPDVCRQQCIDRFKYCDGVIDLESSLWNDGHYAVFFRSLTDPKFILLYPDELYCSGRLAPLFGFVYVLAALTFGLCLIVVYRSIRLLTYMRRRHKRRKAKLQQALKLQREVDYGTMEP
eukprot:maker-scaffold403_size186359-snap-gene-0.48 protein:Tk07451 transcript:maker-scaffold403_size186359-snap-gene-0.48-mRNA-1 annotation:"---NA---"